MYPKGAPAYKVFLAEDEIVVREGIRNNIPWDETPYSLVGEAPDGEMALSMIQDIKPDILITDIRMPFMDGLALSRIVKKTLPWIKRRNGSMKKGRNRSASPI